MPRTLRQKFACITRPPPHPLPCDECQATNTRREAAGAQREMLLPAIIGIIAPIIVGIILGVNGVVGMLGGATASGFVLAIMMANAGGAWDNAKKYIEWGKGQLGGKGGEAHKASVVGDTVGDPFKDTSGPSINILIKLLSMVSIVFVALTIRFHIL